MSSRGDAHLFDFGEHILSVLDERWELAGFVEARAKQTWNLLDD